MKSKVPYIIIRGPLGVGKSTIARELAKKLKGEYFEVDDILERNNLDKGEKDGYIFQKNFKKANEIIVPKAKRALNIGKSVIFDGNFYWKSQIKDLINRLNFPSYTFTLKLPLKRCIERDKNRAKPLGKDAVKAIYKKVISFDYGIDININKKTEKEVIKEILTRLK
jgi:tRNA uridine 5-carbamoylmethylation protein Kti12